ncbi:MAG: anaerobic ribonucleoside-triphosphate reductase activating protein [Desulfovibrio sp.]|jgi:pyruvate formate lyase activating enzyme|nr:anaerobic ribonucleoside-triphosphate reductase activating protein [Desulfovibrio sp.]
MLLGALQKTTMLDFPGKVSAIVFTQGCNFLCPYCHNSGLVCGQEALAIADVLAFLAQRKRFLEGVVITGGEPTLQDDLPSFCSILKSIGYAVKLDTNGSKPDILRRLLQLDLLDYVAMDVKADPRQYPKKIFPGSLGESIIESMTILSEFQVPHEFRIPCVAPFVDADSFQGILEATQSRIPLFLQTVRLERVLEPDFFTEKERALERGEMETLKRQADACGRTCTIR